MTDLTKTHPVLVRSLPLTKYLTGRDHLTVVPDMPSETEAELLIKQYKVYEHRSVTGGFQWSDCKSYRGQPPILKVTAMRCMWFGWLNGRDWTLVGWLTPEGKAVLHRHLSEREATKDAESTKLRKRWYPTPQEIAQQEADERELQRKQGEKYDLRDRRFDEASKHRTRLNGVVKALMDLTLKIGRGEVNDIDGAIDQLRSLTKQHDIEQAWTNSFPYPDN